VRAKYRQETLENEILFIETLAAGANLYAEHPNKLLQPTKKIVEAEKNILKNKFGEVINPKEFSAQNLTEWKKDVEIKKLKEELWRAKSIGKFLQNFARLTIGVTSVVSLALLYNRFKQQQL
jgi:hypothetical protein